jgi:hypothetical protein
MRPYFAMNIAIAFTLLVALILGSLAARAEDKPKTTTSTTTTSTDSSSGKGSGLGAGKAEFDDFNATKGTNPKGPSGQAAGQSSGQGAHAAGGGGHK